MRITGSNLAMVRDGLDSLQAGLKNQIVTCPDETVYAEPLKALHVELKRCNMLIGRVKFALWKERR